MIGVPLPLCSCGVIPTAMSLRKEQSVEKLSFGQRLMVALRYGYVDMVQDIGRWLVMGLIIAALITVLVPDDFFLRFADTPMIGMLLMIAISIPMYVCATGSIPIAVALMLKGITPGAALVLLMAGPACNMASILVIRKVLGKRTLWFYLLSITLGAIVFGLGIDYLLPREWFTSHLTQSHACCHEAPEFFNDVCSVVLGALLVYALIKRLIPTKNNHTMEKRLFKVEGMMCNHCRANVEKALQQLAGVTSVEVDLTAGTAAIEGSVSDEEVINSITGIGYSATKLSN